MPLPNDEAIYHHGTTLQRGEAIMRDGPLPDYQERHAIWAPQGFCVTAKDGPFPLGSPEDYARTKALNFPNEGGPVMLEMVIPDEIIRLCETPTGDLQFDYGYGIEELRAAWPLIQKQLCQLEVKP